MYIFQLYSWKLVLPVPETLLNCAKSLQLCLTLCHRMDCNSPGSSVPRIFQARILEWIAIASSRGSSQSRDRTQVSYVYQYWQVGSLSLAPRMEPLS